MDMLAAFGVIVVFAAWAALVIVLSGKFTGLSDAPPELPPTVPPPVPLSPARLPAIAELVPRSPERVYRVWLFDGVKFHGHTGAGRRPFRITALGASWDQQGTHLDGLPIYVRSDAPPRKQRSKGTA